MTNPYTTTVIINKCDKDKAVMTHRVSDMRLMSVERKTGASVRDKAKFLALNDAIDRGLLEQECEESRREPLDMPSFLTGLFGGFCISALIVALVAFVKWALV